MVEAISKSHSPNIGLSSDFHRRLSVTNTSAVGQGQRIPSQAGLRMARSSSLHSIADSEDSNSTESTPGTTS